MGSPKENNKENNSSESKFRKGSTAYKFCELSDVDWVTGYSKEVRIELLEKNGLALGNGGSWCRSDGPLGRVFNITRNKKGNKIISVKLDGFNKNVRSKKISDFIREHFKGERCRVLSVGDRNVNIEIDHKDGAKDDISVDEDQKIEDFQPLSKAANGAKREHCKKCQKSKVRFDATKLGYKYSQWIGGKAYVGSCVGCYWYDPKEFNRRISEEFKKSDV